MKRILASMLSILFLCPAFGREVKAQDYDYTEFNKMVETQYMFMDAELSMIEDLRGTEEYIIEYNQITQKYETLYGLDVAETIYDVFDADEIETVAKVVEAETNGAPFAAKVNVASVVFNRYQDGTYEFPDDLSEIVEQDGQFAKAKDSASEETMHALEYAYTIGDTTGGALWFNKSGINSWAERNREKLFTDEVGHSFYR